MKKIFVIAFALCLLVSAPASAQFNWGIKAGMNLTGKPSDIKGAKDAKNGFFIGPMAKVMLPIVGLGIEGNILYSQSGSEFGGKDVTRHSLEIPLYLRYELSIPLINKFLEPFIEAGPQFGWVIGDGKETFNSVAQWEYKKSNLSLNLGLGATVLSKIQLHVNYNIALGNTGEFKSDPTGGTWDYVKGSKVNTWQISAAYIF